MNLIDPVSIYFSIPATDHLGKNQVEGKLRFLETHVELSWRLKGSVFTGGEKEMTSVDFSYGEIEGIELKHSWFRPIRIIVRVAAPEKLTTMPSISVGKMDVVLDNKSKQEAKKLEQILAYKKSEFILNTHESRLNGIRGDQ
jgi:hypothetical protein